ncbi:MAG: hypothetical protein IJ934_00660 [Acetobacter sp.]|nr:hypothetical protein [Acetobacter sp.]MBR2123683.1 hypothetical protein [Acetobacter sp.]
MAKSLFLCKYQETSTGRYIDGTEETIETCFIDEDIFQHFEKWEVWCKQEIFEDEEEKESTNVIEYIDHDKIESVIKEMQKLFLDKRYEKIQRKELEENPHLLTNVIKKFRTICNIIFLLQLKFDQYPTDSRVIVQLG